MSLTESQYISEIFDTCCVGEIINSYYLSVKLDMSKKLYKIQPWKKSKIGQEPIFSDLKCQHFFQE